jgi:hypothetical protein
MHTPMGKVGRKFLILRLLAISAFLLISATVCHAQCFDGPSGVHVTAIISPIGFAPGQTYNASVTVAAGGFNPAAICPPAVFYIVNAASYEQGLYYAEDPYVTVSNLAYVSTTEITFTVTVASNAPTESDAWADISGGSGGAGGAVWLVSGLGAVSITPCALPVTPTITSIQPSVFPAGASTPITITGTGFMPTTNANSCAPTTVSITAGSENVALSAVNVVSPTEITLTAAPKAGDPTEAASVTAANYSLNGPPYYLYSNAEPAQICSCAPPKISSISPPRGLIGTTITNVTIKGSGLSIANVNVPPGIQVSKYDSQTDAQIVVDLDVTSGAQLGNNELSVTANQRESNTLNFFVQTPTSLSIVSGTASGSEKLCTSNACGTIVTFKYQVNDQEAPPHPIEASMSMWDSFGSFSPDGLKLGGVPLITTCSPATNTGPCGVYTNTDGTFTEGALGGCSTVCHANGVCTTGGPSDVPQTWHIASEGIVQTISEYCQKVLVNGVQPK